MTNKSSARGAFLATIISVVFFLPSLASAALPASTNVLPGRLGDPAQVAMNIASAGRLRMQSQRLAKLYQQAGMAIDMPASLIQIGLGTTELDAEFSKLAPYARKPNIERVFRRCESLWHEMRLALKATPDRPASERVNRLADELVIHAGKLAMLIEAEAETPVGRLLDLSSRLNMLSQRLARLYLQVQTGERSPGVLIDIDQARKEFSVGLQELDTARENTSASRDAITLAKNQWIFFELAIGQLNQVSRSDGKASRNVMTSSERIAQVLDLASSQYARDYADGLRGVK